MTKAESKRFSEPNIDTGLAEQAVEILFTDFFIQGAEVDSRGVRAFPYEPLELDLKLEKELKEGRIARVSRPLPNGGRRRSYVIPRGSYEHLAATPSNTGSLFVTLVTVRDGLIFSAPLFNRPILMQGFIAASKEAIEKRGIDLKNVMLAPTTIVKNALRNIGELNGTEREVGERLMQEYEAGREEEWKEVHNPIDFSSIRKALSDRLGH